MYKTNETYGNNLGKFLSWILRHGAVKEGILIEKDGFVPIYDLLEHRFIKNRYTINDIKAVVESDSKRRFALQLQENVFYIRANQGHSIGIIQELELASITNASDVECVVHGTFIKNWDKIKVEGLHRMKRNHIHFSQHSPDCCAVTSGLRNNAEIYIYIDLEAALQSGLQFFVSANKVVLSPGDKEGYIKPVFFQKVCTRDGSQLTLQ